MTRATAHAIWGVEAVELALLETAHAEVTPELSAEVQRRRDPLGSFRAWALALPWPTFCAVVRIVAGVVREEVEKR